jgi:hypothetical protein
LAGWWNSTDGTTGAVENGYGLPSVFSVIEALENGTVVASSGGEGLRKI